MVVHTSTVKCFERGEVMAKFKKEVEVPDGDSCHGVYVDCMFLYREKWCLLFETPVFKNNLGPLKCDRCKEACK